MEEETAFLINLVNLMLSKDSSSFDSYDFMKMYRYQIIKMWEFTSNSANYVFFLGSRHIVECFTCVLLFKSSE